MASTPTPLRFDGLTASQRRMVLRKLLTDANAKMSPPFNESAFLSAARSTSIPRVRTIGRTTFSGVRDILPSITLFGLLTGEFVWTDFYAAIRGEAACDALGCPDWAKAKTSSKLNNVTYSGLNDSPEWQEAMRIATTPKTKTSKTSKGTPDMASINGLINAFSILVKTKLAALDSQVDLDELGLSHEEGSKDALIGELVTQIVPQFVTKLGGATTTEAVTALFDDVRSSNPDFYKDVTETSEGRVLANDVIADYADYYNGASVSSDGEGVEGEGSSVVAAAPEVYSIPVKEEFKNILNMTLAQATGGTFSDIGDVVKVVNESRTETARLKADYARLRETVSSRPAMPASVPSDGTLPAGKIVSKNAKTIFVGPAGRKSKVLDMDIPVIEWDGHNPHVPAIDPNYRFKPGKLLQFLFALKENKKAWLHGHTGTGKTTFVEQVCARLGYMFMRVNLDSEITRMDLIGRDILKTDEHGNTVSEFVEGILPTAMRLGGLGAVLCCDEVSFGRADVMYVFQRALEDKGLLLSEDGGRVVQPCPMFRIVATDNTRGQGDEFGAYQGARPQSSAFLDRFTVWIEFEYMKQEEEVSLLKDIIPGIPDNVANGLAHLAKEIREAFTGGQIFQTCSPRGVLTAAEGFMFFNDITKDAKAALQLAVESSMLSKASDQDRAAIKGFADRCLRAA